MSVYIDPSHQKLQNLPPNFRLKKPKIQMFCGDTPLTIILLREKLPRPPIAFYRVGVVQNGTKLNNLSKIILRHDVVFYCRDNFQNNFSKKKKVSSGKVRENPGCTNRLKLHVTLIFARTTVTK